MSSAKKQYRCSDCGREFRRLEHLTRHSFTHSKVAHLKCRACPKAFSRPDALQRHQAIHTSGRNLVEKGRRACTTCASVKTRCSGTEPCSRCSDRSIECIYPQRRSDDGNDRPDDANHADKASHLGLHKQAQQALTTAHGLAQDVIDWQQHQLISPPLETPNTAPAVQQLGWPEATAIAQAQPFSSPSLAVPVLDEDAPLDHMVNLDYFDIGGATRMNWLDEIQDDCQELSTLDGLPSQLLTNTVAEPFGWSYLPNFMYQSAAVSPAFDTLTTISTASPAESHHEPPETEPGQYYVDGESARLTKYKRRLLRRSKAGPSPHQDVHGKYSLAYDESDFVALVKPEMDLLPQTHAVLETFYTNLCLQPHGQGTIFEASVFPSGSVFGYLVHLYHKHFDASLPIIHPAATFTTSHAALQTLAMATIGTHYTPDGLISDLFSSSLHEFLRRALQLQLDKNVTQPLDLEVIARVRLLHAIASIYSADEVVRRRVLEDSNPLPAAYRAARIMLAATASTSANTKAAQDFRFQIWLARQQSLRLLHAAWLLDYMWKYQFQIEPRFTIADAVMPLPCSAKVWSAKTPEEWDELNKQEPTQEVPLAALLNQLYVDKSISTTTSDFATSLLIHGILRRTHEVGLYYASPLSSYVPSPRPQKSADVLPGQPICLPAIPDYARWQSSACDAIDILHWQANAAIGLAAGMEHPSVLHLHMSRVILLVPYENIVSIAEAWAASRPINTTDRDLLRRWITEGQYKARLAVIHAGVTFWHVRRYSIDAFYEAPAVALATLTLWAFSTFSTHKKGLDSAQDAQDDHGAGIILLDRPTDDELVQDFIRDGPSMRTFLTGIGDLYDATAPRKVLQQGCKLLDTLTCWGIQSRWLDLFNRLVALHD